MKAPSIEPEQQAGEIADQIQARLKRIVALNQDQEKDMKDGTALEDKIVARAASFRQVMAERCPALHNRRPDSVALRNRAAMTAMTDSVSPDGLSPQEEAILQRDEARYDAENFRRGDQDARPVPWYLPSESIIRKIFMEAVKKYLDLGMSYRAAWLKAKANNPAAFYSYTTR